MASEWFRLFCRIRQKYSKRGFPIVHYIYRYRSIQHVVHYEQDFAFADKFAVMCKCEGRMANYKGQYTQASAGSKGLT